ncbi:MAG: hypothetical protein ABSB58_02470 [Gemmatimonadales bacterium]|jgi:subtilisin family serine protease
MIRSIARIALASAVLSAPALAQTRETEYGADISIRWSKPSSGDGTLHIVMPVDFRVAFHNGALALEPRISGQYLSSGGDNIYLLDPGVNILIALPGSTHRNGTYSLIGADLMIVGGSGMAPASAVSLSGGFGLRRPMGKAATRAELFVGYTPKQTNAAETTTFGMRLGFSFFN